MLRQRRGRIHERSRAGRRLCLAIPLALAVVAVAALAASPAWGIFRAFSPSSPWNQTAVPGNSSNPYASQFTDRPGLPLRISGTPDNITYASPTYFATRGDPTTTVFVTKPDWLPDGATRWDGKPVPVPSGVSPAPGSDGHLTVVSADRDTAWEFLGCTQAGTGGYVTGVIVQWDLTGLGYSTEYDETSARGSGLPLISSSLRADEALNGIRHALGFTVPRVSQNWMSPAAHSDGKQGPDAIKYGMRFVLRPDYPVPANASLGVINVIYALKVYGAYIVDQGADFEMDADFTHQDLWAQAGVNYKSFNFTASDLRPAVLGTPPQLPTLVMPVTESRRRPMVTLRAGSRPLRVGRSLYLRGKVRAQLNGGERANVEARTRGRWRHLVTTPIRGNGKYGVKVKVKRAAHSSTKGHRLLMHHLHFRPGLRKLRLRVIVRGVGWSSVVVVPIRR